MLFEFYCRSISEKLTKIFAFLCFFDTNKCNCILRSTRAKPAVQANLFSEQFSKYSVEKLKNRPAYLYTKNKLLSDRIVQVMIFGVI